MDKSLKEILKIAKRLHNKELIYLHDSTNLEVEPNYQLLSAMVEDFNLTMSKEDYKLVKENKEELINKLALLTFDEKALIGDEDIEFMEFLIKEFVDISDPLPIEDIYVFNIQFNKLQELYDKALNQIGDGKFKNIIF